MTDGPVRGIGCTACGAPLAPRGNQVRVQCSYCGALNDVASAGAVQTAKRLDALNIRIPDKPMTVEEIEQGFRERALAEAAARRRNVLVALIVVAVLGLLLLGLAIAAG